MESRTKCTRCGTDPVTSPLRDVGNERLCGVCVYDETGEGTVVTCVDCRTRRDILLGDETGERLLRESLCFSCDFWRAYEAMKDDPDVVRVGGQHFIIGEPFLVFRGFGGTRFVIEFFDGRRRDTDCLWTQGTIPERFRGRLPDNAKFA